LVAQRDDALITSSRDDFRFSLVVWTSQSFVEHHFLDNWLSFLNFLSLGWSLHHDTVVESLQVNMILSLLKVVSVLVRSDLEVFASLDGRKSAVLRNINDSDWFESFYPFFFDIEFLSKTFFGL